jgi:two-component system sensor histidine kinase YesM
MMHVFRTLQGKIFLCAILSVVVGVSISTFLIYRQATTIMKKQAIDYATNDIGNIASQLENLFVNASNVSLKVAVNSDVLDESVRYLPQASYEEFLQEEKVRDILDNVITNDKTVQDVAFYRPDGSVFSSGTMFKPKDDLWGNGSVLPEGREDVFIYPETDGSLFVPRRLKYMKNEVGIVYVQISLTHLKSVLNDTSIQKNAIAIFSADGRFLSGNSMPQWTNKQNKEKMEPILSLEDGDYVREIEGATVFALVRTIAPYGIRLVSLVPYNILISDTMKIQRLILVIAVLCIFLCFFISWFFSIHICKDLDNLRLTMLKVRQGGDVQIRAGKATTEEVEDMAEIFNSMMAYLQELREKEAETEAKKKEVEQDYLRLQIQPHFIYGTINSMKYLAHFHGDIEIEQVATALAELLRAVLGNEDQFVTIAQEKYYIEEYLVIQRCKYRKSFEIVWDISEDFREHLVPKLMLQTLVDNALVHGIKDMDDGKITVRIVREGKTIHCTVEDNGIGMDETKPVSIRKGYNFTSIGLKNVFDRIQLLYGDEGDVSIESVPHKGTLVTLVMPL